MTRWNEMLHYCCCQIISAGPSIFPVSDAAFHTSFEGEKCILDAWRLTKPAYHQSRSGQLFSKIYNKSPPSYLTMMQQRENPTRSTFKVILDVWERMVISRKQEHLHSYNSQKCINDHQRREDLREHKRQTTTILSCMKLYFFWHSSCLKCQPTAKIEKKNNNSSHSSCLTKPAVRIRVGGTKSVCSTKCSHSPFPGFQCLGKKLSFHEYSTSK